MMNNITVTLSTPLDKSAEFFPYFPEFTWKRTKVEQDVYKYPSTTEHYRGESLSGTNIRIFVYIYGFRHNYKSVETRVKINGKSFYHNVYQQSDDSLETSVGQLRRDFEAEYHRYNSVSQSIQSTFTGW